MFDKADLDAGGAGALRALSLRSGTFRMNVALAELPDFTAAPGTHLQPHHASGILVGDSLGYFERAYFDALEGTQSRLGARAGGRAGDFLRARRLAGAAGSGMSPACSASTSIPSRTAAGTRIARPLRTSRSRPWTGMRRTSRPACSGGGSAVAAGPRARVRPARRRHLSWRARARPAVQRAAAARPGRLPRRGAGPLPVRFRHAPGRRRDGPAGHECGARDPARSLARDFGPERTSKAMIQARSRGDPTMIKRLFGSDPRGMPESRSDAIPCCFRHVAGRAVRARAGAGRLHAGARASSWSSARCTARAWCSPIRRPANCWTGGRRAGGAGDLSLVAAVDDARRADLAVFRLCTALEARDPPCIPARASARRAREPRRSRRPAPPPSLS
jgi:hypothetical protein